MKDKLKCALDRFEGDFAVLVFDSGDKLTLPKDNLPASCVEGDILEVDFSKNGEETASARQIAKNLLNEILSNS